VNYINDFDDISKMINEKDVSMNISGSISLLHNNNPFNDAMLRRELYFSRSFIINNIFGILKDSHLTF